MEKSSNQNMNQVLEKLAKIKKVDPSTDLYTQTLNRIQRKNIISLFWIRVAACLFIAFISTELYFAAAKNNTSKEDFSAVIYKTNNILYNE